MKRLHKILILGCLVPSIASADFLSDAFIKLFSRLMSKGLASYRSTTIAHSEFDPSQAPGKIISNVNIFNGQPYYSIPLASINARGVSWNFNLNYYGGVQPILQSSNETAPSGLYGLGWNMSTPYVAVNHQNTVTTTDDFYYCNLGPYGSGQILQNSDGDYFVSTNPYIKVVPTISAKRFVKWKFIMQDGTTLYFGENDNSRRSQLYFGNVIAAYPANIANAGNFTYRYDLSRVTDFNEVTSILFEYSKVEEPVAQGKSYTRESALSSVYWKDGNVTVDSISFVYQPMLPSEYPGYGASEAKNTQRLYETRYLSKVKRFVQGNLYEVKVLSQELAQVQLYAEKRYLMSVRDSIYLGEARSWTFGYNYMNALLDSITRPDNTVDHFSYTDFPWSENSEASSSVVPDTMRDASGQKVQIPEVERSRFSNWSACTEEFCYASLMKKTGDGSRDLYVQVYHNDGNYFSEPFGFQMNGEKQSTLFPSSNYFVMADVYGQQVSFYEWDGFRFVNMDSVVGEFFTDRTKLSGVIENVITQENFFLIVEKDNQKRRVYPVVRNPSTGKWTFLNRDKGQCGFANMGDYGDPIRDADSDACLEWNGVISVDASPTMFIVGQKGYNVLNVFAYQDGSFNELTNCTSVFQDYGVQKTSSSTTYTMNFQGGLGGLTLSGNTLFMTLNKANNVQQIVGLYFDGVSFHEMANEIWNEGYPQCDRDNICGDNFVITENFVVEISKAKSKVFLWRKKYENGRIIFELNRDCEIFDFDGANNDVFYSVSKDAVYLEERYPSMRPVIRDGSYHNKLLYIPSNPSLPGLDRTSELDSNVFGLQFSQSDPVVFFQTGLTDDNKLCIPNVLCRVGPYSRMRNFIGAPFFRGDVTPEYPLNFNHFTSSNQSLVSAPNRLMARTIVDSISNSNLIGLVQFSGQNYTSPQAYPVVDRFWKGNSYDQTNRYKKFSYAGTENSSIVEFNTHTQQAQFVSPEVSSVAFKNNVTASKTTYDFVADLKDDGLVGYQKNLQGALRMVRDYDQSGALRSRVQKVFAVDSGKGCNWPNGLVVNLMDSSVSMSVDHIGNRKEKESKKLHLDNASGLFVGTLVRTEPYWVYSQKILETQTLVDNPDNMIFRNPVARYNYVPFDQSPLVSIKYSNPSQVFFEDSVASASKTSYSSKFPGMAIAHYRWQAPLRNGPGFPLSSGWVLADTVISMDDYGHVTENSVLTNVGMRSNCRIYEGHRVLLAGLFSGAACSDVVLSTAEHGDLNGWEMAQTVLDSFPVFDGRYAQTHSGLYVFKVTDGFGPTRNIALKELHRYHYSYVISGFAFSSSARPMLVVEFRRADNSIARVVGNSEPVGESFKPNRWQRYEIKIPYTELVADGMFADTASGDYLRIWLGTGSPTGNSSKVIYVDDIVAYPSSSTFSVKSYDKAGLTLTTMGMNFQKVEYVYDRNHRKRAVRDFKGRIFSDKAKHRIGENMGVNND